MLRWALLILALGLGKAYAHQGITWVFSAAYQEETRVGVQATIHSPYFSRSTTFALVCTEDSSLFIEVSEESRVVDPMPIAISVDKDRFVLTNPVQPLTNEGEPNGAYVRLSDEDPVEELLEALKAGYEMEVSHPNLQGPDWSLGVWSLRGSRVAIEALERSCGF